MRKCNALMVSINSLARGFMRMTNKLERISFLLNRLTGFPGAASITLALLLSVQSGHNGRAQAEQTDQRLQPDEITRSAQAPLTWLPLPSTEAPLTRIAFGSCLHQSRPQPIWRSVIAAKPQLFLMLGDNVYGDIKSADHRELKRAYTDLAAHEDFATARAAFPILATWDDHDYGSNDSGADFIHRAVGREQFRSFWKGSGSTSGKDPEGIHHARSFGPEGRRVQIIMLDTRSFRSPLLRKPKGASGRGPYQADPSAEKTILGSRQWAWLEQELKKPADLRFIVSSIQVLADGHGWERWGNFPTERQRLFQLISNTDANGVIFLSGDRHRAAMYLNSVEGSYPLNELTSSALNLPIADTDEHGPYQLAPMYASVNFGSLSIDWRKRSLTMRINSLDGKPVHSREVLLADLTAKSVSPR